MPGFKVAPKAAGGKPGGKAGGKSPGKLHGAGNCGSGKGGFRVGNTCGHGGRAKLAADIRAARAKADAGEADHREVRKAARELRHHRRGKEGAVSDGRAKHHRDALRMAGKSAPATPPGPAPKATAKPKPKAAIPPAQKLAVKPAPKPALPKPAKLGTPQDRAQRAGDLRLARKSAKSKADRTKLAASARHDRLTRRDKHEDHELAKSLEAPNAARVAAHVATARAEIAAAHQANPVAHGAHVAAKIAGHKAGDVAAKHLADIESVHAPRIAALEARQAHYETLGRESAGRFHAVADKYRKQPAKYRKEYERAQRDNQRAVAGYDRAGDRIAVARAEYRGHAHAILEQHGGPKVRHVEEIYTGSGQLRPKGPPAEIAKSVREGSDFVSRMTGPTGPGVAVQPVYEPGVRANYRSNPHDLSHGKIVHDAADTPDVVAHEIGHGIEHQHPNIGRLSGDFLDHRVGDEPLVKLKDVHGPTSAYRDDEVGRKDRFDEAFGGQAHYVGKHYPNGHTEILSMGIQKLHDDPVHLAKKDLEMFKYIHGIMTGVIR